MGFSRDHRYLYWCFCRTCGGWFPAGRLDAESCGATCRKERQRNGGHAIWDARPPVARGLFNRRTGEPLLDRRFPVEVPGPEARQVMVVRIRAARLVREECERRRLAGDE